PHFVVLLLPAYCLARAALLERDGLAGWSLAVALTCSVVSNRILMGETIGLRGQEWGLITWCGLALLIGAAARLLRAVRCRENCPGSTVEVMVSPRCSIS